MLQFERSGIGGLSGGARRAQPGAGLAKLAKESVGESGNAIADTAVRKDVTVMNMNRNAFQLTAQRANEENKSGIPGAATSIFKLYGAALLTEEMEKLTQAVLNETVASVDDAVDVLMQAILQLPQYLEHLASSKDDFPMVLLPLLQERYLTLEQQVRR